MPNGRNHNFVIQTRQKDDILFSRSSDADPIAAAESFEFKARRVAGYSQIRFLAFAGAAAGFTIHVLQGTTGTGPFVETDTLTSAPGPGGEQLVCENIEPCGSFMKLILENTSGSPQAPELQVLGHPV